MQPSSSPAGNDPHDVLEIAPDVVLVALAEEELSRLAKNRSSNSSSKPKTEPPPLRTDTGVSPSEVPVVDTSFRAARTDDGPSMARRIGRGAAGLLIAVCVGGAAVAWRASGEAAKQVIADWAPQFAAKSSPPAEQSEPSAQDATPAAAAPVQQSAATTPAAAQDSTTPAATTSLAVTAAAAIPAPADPAQQLQSMARDLANLGQEVTLLKASLAELKASNEQMSRDMAKASEQNQRLKVSAMQPRPAVPPTRKPQPTLRPTQAAAPALPPPSPASYPPPQSAAPYPPPQTAYVPPPAPVAQPPVDPDIPRPPMPVRQ
jgi:hypothetical protein